MVCENDGKGDLAVGKGIQGAGGLCWDFDFVTDCAAIATAVKDERVVWERHGF